MPPRRPPQPPSYDGSWGDDAPPDPSVAWEPAPTAPASSIPPEQAGRYRAPDTGPGQIGQGGIGVVLAVWDEVLGREVACKVLTSSATAATARRFVREARATARLQHPGIVPVYDLGRRPDGTPFYTMKYVRGRTLAAAIVARKSLAERLELLGAFVDACHAIAYAHSRGVLHRDIKPANVMVGEFGETVVLDWGLARVLGEPSPEIADGAASADPTLTVAGSILGTPAYMSPEQARGELALDARADTWSLGVVLYEILAGHPPFQGIDTADVLRRVREGRPRPIQEVVPRLSPDLAAIVGRALAPAPGDRYADAEALAADVEAWRTGGRVDAYAYSALELLRRFVGRHRLPFTVGAIAAIALCALGATSYVRVLAERNRALAAEEVAVRRETEALSNLADALAEKAVATPEIDPYTAELYAAGALAMGERPEARGVIARTRRRWAPRILERFPVPADCGTLAWAGEDLLCLAKETVLALRPDHSIRFSLSLPAPRFRSEIALSPDGTRAAIALEGGTAVVLDVRSGTIVQRIVMEAPANIRTLVFSPDGTRLYTSANADIQGLGVSAWDVATGRRIATSYPIYVESLAWRAGGELWAACWGLPAGSRRHVVRLDPETLALGTELPGFDVINGLAWSPDGRWLSGDNGDGRTLVWSGADLTAEPRYLGDRGGGIGITRWDPAGRHIADLREDGRVRFWQPGTWTRTFGMSLPALLWRALAFAPDGRRFATASNASVTLWELGEPPPVDGFSEPSPGTDLSFLVDGSSFVSSSPDRLVRWGLDGARLAQVLTPDHHSGMSVGPSESGEATVLVGASQDTHAIELDSGTLLWHLPSGPTRYAVFADDGRCVVTLGEDGVLHGWRPDGTRLWEHPGTGGYSHLFGGDEPNVLAFGRIKGIDVLTCADGTVRRLTDGDELYFGGLSRNGRWAVLSGRDGTLFVYDTRSGAEVDRMKPYEGMNVRVAASDDGRLIAAGGADRAIRLWDRELGRVAAVLRGHDYRLQALAFSPDAKLLVSTAWENESRSWDLSELWTAGPELLRRAEERSYMKLDGVTVSAP